MNKEDIEHLINEHKKLMIIIYEELKDGLDVELNIKNYIQCYYKIEELSKLLINTT
jgi:hypothetical protein